MSRGSYKDSNMKILRLLLIYLIPVVITAQILDQNFIVTSGIQSGIDKGDSLNRASFFVAIPADYPGKIYFRIFDADLGDTYDNPVGTSETRYLIFGQQGYYPELFSLQDTIEVNKALISLILGADKYYDNRWRTIGTLTTQQGYKQADKMIFQVVIDGIKGKGRNLYQLAISTDEKRNEPIAGMEVSSPSVAVRLASNPQSATQVTFLIPDKCDTLIINNFDADIDLSPNRIKFETNFRNNILIPPSKDGRILTKKIAIQKEEQGHLGALIIEGNSITNNIQFWVTDKNGKILLLDYPPLLAPINHLPDAKFKVIPLAECNTMILDATESADSDGDEVLFKWFFEDNTTEEGIRIAHDFKKSGKHLVKLSVIDNSIFIANTTRLTQTIVINDPPTAVIENPPKAAPYQTVSFSGSKSFDNDGKILNYHWNMGDGNQKEGQNIEYKYTRPGTYEVTLTVEDDGTTLCTKAKSTASIWINKSPQAKFNLVKNLVAVNESVVMHAQGSIDSDGEIVKYMWDFGDGAQASGIETSHQYTKPGKYTVKLTATDDSELANAESHLQEVVTVNAPPVAVAEFPAVVAADELVIFDATKSSDSDGQISEYNWSLGDGTIKSGMKVSYQYVKPGTYPIQLKVIDNTPTANNSNTADYKIRVNSSPVPDAGGDRLVNESVVYFDGSRSRDSDDEIIEYSWNFGDNTSTKGVKVNHVYASPGTYLMTLTVKDASGTKSAIQSQTVQIIVNSPPVADAGRDQVVSIGEKVKFNGGFSNDSDGKIVTYKWDVAEGVTLEGKRVEYTYNKPGLYQVRLTVTDNDGGTDIHYTTIHVNNPPVALIAPIPRIAPGQSITFDGSMSYDVDGKIESAVWDFGDGSLAKKGLKTKYSYREPGRYSMTLTVNDNSNATNGITKSTQPIAVNYPPKAASGSDILTCDQTILFDGTNSSDADGDKLTYSWDFGDGTVASGMKLEHVYKMPGVYPVVLRVDDGQELSNSIQQTMIRVQVNSAPLAFAEVNRDTVCAGEPVIFDASKSFDMEKDLMRYLWDFGDGSTLEGINPIHSYKRGGNYKVRLTVSDATNLPCNTSISDLLIHAIDAPVADAGINQTVCANTVVQFDGSKSSGGDRLIKSYEWDFGDGERGGGVNPTHVYTKAGLYTVRLEIMVPEIGDCENTSESEITVKVISAPTAKFTMIEQGCIGEEIEYDASGSFAENSNIITYDWDFGDGSTGKGVKTKHAYLTEGRYPVKLSIKTDSNQGCNDAVANSVIMINAAPKAQIEVCASNEEPTDQRVYQNFINTMLNFNGNKSTDKDGFLKTYLWDFGDGAKAEGVFTKHQYKNTGSYKVRLYVEDNSNTYCDYSLDSITVNIIDYSEIAITGTEAAFIGEELEYKLETAKKITATNENTEWFFSDGTTMKGLAIKKTFDKAGKFQVQAKCANLWSLAREITIDALPEIQVPDSQTVDVGMSVKLIPAISNPFKVPVKYEWDMGDKTNIKGIQAEHIFTNPGDYKVTFRVWYKEIGYGRPKEYKVPLKVLAAPVVEIATSPEVLYVGGARDVVMFEAKVQPYERNLIFEWDFGDGATAVGKIVKHTYLQAADYTVKLTVYDATRVNAKKYSFKKRITLLKR